jgi:hypothetical protein
MSSLHQNYQEHKILCNRFKTIYITFFGTIIKSLEYVPIIWYFNNVNSLLAQNRCV